METSSLQPETSNLQRADQDAVDLARECLYRFLAAAITDPYTPGWAALLDPPSQRLASEAASLLRDEAAEPSDGLAFGELPAEHLDFDPVIAHLGGAREAIQADYDRIFGLLVPRECPPYETEYHRSGDAFFRAQQLADVAGFYRAFGVDPAASRPERPDHIGLELEFMALLLTKRRLAGQQSAENCKELADTCQDAECEFFAEHLAWWVPCFATGLRRKAETGFYADLAKTLAALMARERSYFGVAGPRGPVAPSLIERPEEQSGCAACPLNL